MRLRLSRRLVLCLLLVGVALSLLSSYWTHCAPDGHLVTQSRVERWRHLQSSVRLDSSFPKRRNNFIQTLQNGGGGKGFSETSDDLGDFDSLDFVDGSLAAPPRIDEEALAAPPVPLPTQEQQRTIQDIDCLINQEYTVPCKREGREVYLPFYKFLRKYFDLYGKVLKTGSNGEERFEFEHSYSRVFFPKQRYDPGGSFLWFQNYNVEVRERVICISANEGVPVSSQWDPSGHIYPIQVAQFGLSHFSKNLTEAKAPVIHVLEGGTIGTHNEAQWSGTMDDKNFFERTDRGTIQFKTKVVHEDEDNDVDGITMILKENIAETTLSLDLLLKGNGSLSILLAVEGSASIPNAGKVMGGVQYRLSYVTTNVRMAVTNKGTIVYGLGTSKGQWRRLTRDIKIDLQKGLSVLYPKKSLGSKIRSVRLKSLTLRGDGEVANISLVSSDHMAHFFAASDYLVAHQDKSGGWPITVTRKLSNGMLELKPGWYSAMAQGQAMSLLTRAFRVTGELKYLESALKATKVFGIRSENHGVLTTFLGKFPWYEEYPTVPSSFVLNGFIYSLIGLYDLKSSCTLNLSCREPETLFKEGMSSLKKMLTLFDTGSGTVYDLRHFSLGVAPNLARWDYHTTHINQLLLLATIDPDPLLKVTAKRWMGYMKGKRATHN